MRKFLVALFVTVVVGTASAFEPQNVECIAPADPGGGWDFTCRQVGKLLYDLDLVQQPVRVVNMPGGVGAVAFARVTGSRNDEENLLVATSTVGITQIAQGRYPAGTDAVRWLAMLGTDVGVIMVPADSQYQSLDDLMNALVEDPEAATVAGSSGIGGWDHLRILMLAQEAGMSGEELGQIRWVQYDGGTDAVTQMLGGHLDVVSTDIGEIAGFIESGDVRVLAVLSDDPLPGQFADLPTAVSQGYDVTGYNWRGFYVGGDVSDEAYQGWVDVLNQLFETEEWQQVAVESGLTPLWRGGEEFDEFVRQSEAQMQEISREIGVLE